MVAGVQRSSEYRGQGRHAAGEHRGVLSTGEGAELVLQDHLVRVAVALINIAVDAAPIHWSPVCGDAVVGGHVDGLVDGTEGIVLPGAGMNCCCLDVHIFIHFPYLLC